MYDLRGYSLKLLHWLFTGHTGPAYFSSIACTVADNSGRTQRFVRSMNQNN